MSLPLNILNLLENKPKINPKKINIIKYKINDTNDVNNVVSLKNKLVNNEYDELYKEFNFLNVSSPNKEIDESLEKKKILIKSSNYYLNNRQKFISFINNLFNEKYKNEINKDNVLDDKQCEKNENNDFSLMSHQKIIKDYINLYTPYRGLLLYHGLGSGKTCSSIAIAEGMKNDKEVVVMTPASLYTNFNEELKKCGDILYRKDQSWTFLENNINNKTIIKKYSKLLNVSDSYIKKNNGLWVVEEKSNNIELSTEQKKLLDEQINVMINNKYKFISYNGINWDKLNIITKGYTINPFDNKVIIIDEAHNFVSRIVNKIENEQNVNSMNIIELITENKSWQSDYNKNLKIKIDKKKEIDEVKFNLQILKEKKVNVNEEKDKNENIRKMNKEIKILEEDLKKINDKLLNVRSIKNAKKRELGSISFRLYNYLMEAQNSKIILLSGTPIINYPNEIAILFNILRGKIKTWHFELTGVKKLYTNNDFEKIFNNTVKNDEIVYDYVDYNKNSKVLMITRNPFGFVKSIDENGEYKGSYRSLNGEISDDEFVKNISNLISTNMQDVLVKNIKLETFKALPDKKDEFIKYFINANSLFKNEDLFKRRIIGLTSYFKSAQESLMPEYDKQKNFHVLNIDMSDHQFKLYNNARLSELKQEEKDKLSKTYKSNDIFNDDKMSTYRIFSRAFCNFVFPDKIKRPFPHVEDRDIFDVISKNVNDTIVDGLDINYDENIEDDDIIEEYKEENSIKKLTYANRINAALRMINNSDYLNIENLKNYSPKFLELFKIIKNNKNSLHLIYSQFRTLEGVGILKLILENNGYTQFKTKINPQTKELELDIKLIETEKGKYKIEKPTFVLYTGTETKQEKELIRNIFNGNWKNIPSNLQKQLKSISNNNMYGDIISIFMITASGAEGITLKNVRFVHITEPYWHPVRMNQVIGRARRICSHEELPKELRTVDVYLYLMKFSENQINNLPIEIKMSDSNMTSDETLYMLSNKKELITENILSAVKDSAIDCVIHKKDGDDLKCYSFALSDEKNKLSYEPSFYKNEKEIQSIVVKQNEINIQKDKVRGSKGTEITYYVNKNTGEIYDIESYELSAKNKDVSLLKVIGKKMIKSKDNKKFYEYVIFK